MKFEVIGAGHAGLLAAALLRDECSIVREQQKSLPSNHSALLRFRTGLIGDLLGIPFKKVRALKGILPCSNPIADAAEYSYKCTGRVSMRSIIRANGIEEVERYIAPTNFTAMLASRVQARIRFGWHWADAGNDVPIISTMPIFALAELLKYPDADSLGKLQEHSRLGFNIIVDLGPNVDFYASLYVPDRAMPFSRVSITGSVLIAECPVRRIDVPDYSNDQLAWAAMKVIGVHNKELIEHSFDRVECRVQKYAKITPIDELARRRFISWATTKFNIYSFGRFATWRPGLLLDDLPHDLSVIRQIAAEGPNNFNQRSKS